MAVETVRARFVCLALASLAVRRGRSSMHSQVDICCELKGLEEAEKENGWPQRAGKVVLQIALTRLARHYGLIGDGTHRPGRQRLRHWGSDDYRPTIDVWRKDGSSAVD